MNDMPVDPPTASREQLRYALLSLARWYDAGQEPKCREGHGWPRAAAGQEPKCREGHGWPRAAAGQEPKCREGHGWPRAAAGQESECDGQEPECRGGHGWPGAARAGQGWPGAAARQEPECRGGHGWPRAAGAAESPSDAPADERIDWLRVVPFIGMHLACVGVLWVGFSWLALGVALALYAVRMFALTGFYHRYFSHRAFKTTRPVQFAFALVGAACVQRGPLWWAAHHRDHHRHADTEADIHSPLRHGFLWSHMGWFLTPRGFRTRWESIPDLRRFPELRWLDRFDIFVPVLLAVGLFLLGRWIGNAYPASGTTGAQLLIWGFFVSTVALFHATVTINSLAHRFGSRRFETADNSRNNWLLALLTFGEGWHNNHHRFPGSARQGFRWWEVDLTYYVLRVLAACGIVWDLKPVPARFRRAR